MIPHLETVGAVGELERREALDRATRARQAAAARPAPGAARNSGRGGGNRRRGRAALAAMDGQQFDSLTKTLAGGIARRGLLRGAAGLVLGLRAAGTRAERAKRPLCHATGDPANPFVVIEVAEPAWETHLAHGDRPFVDCCADADCPRDGDRCVEGACQAACRLDDSVCGAEAEARGCFTVAAPGGPVCVTERFILIESTTRCEEAENFVEVACGCIDNGCGRENGGIPLLVCAERCPA